MPKQIRPRLRGRVHHARSTRVLVALAVVASVLALPGAAGAQAAEDKPGSVSISADPEVGTALTATLSDPDGGVTSASWRWSRSKRPDRDFTNISNANSSSYTPVAADSAMFLKATVSYTDSHGSGKSAEAVTSLPVGVSASTMLKNVDQQSSRVQFSNPFFTGFVTGPNPAGYAVTAFEIVRLSPDYS